MFNGEPWSRYLIPVAVCMQCINPLEVVSQGNITLPEGPFLEWVNLERALWKSCSAIETFRDSQCTSNRAAQNSGLARKQFTTRPGLWHKLSKGVLRERNHKRQLHAGQKDFPPNSSTLSVQ